MNDDEPVHQSGVEQESADVTAGTAEFAQCATAEHGDSAHFDAGRLTHWLRPPQSEVQRAQRSEDHFVLRLVALLAVFGTVATFGVLKVKRTTVGVRTAYDLVRTSDELRMQLDENRRLEAQLTGMKNPNLLRKEAADHFDMRAPATGDSEDVE